MFFVSESMEPVHLYKHYCIVVQAVAKIIG